MSTQTSGVVTQTRGSHLLVQELGDELVIFNRRTNTAHMLNAQASAVYRAAEGGCSLEEAARLMASGSDAQKAAAAAIAIADLATAGVIEGLVEPVSRRSLLRTLGATAALPMVISILAPTPAAATSNISLRNPCFPGDSCALDGICDHGVCCLPQGFGDCTDNADCCRGLVCQFPVGPGPTGPGICNLPA